MFDWKNTAILRVENISWEMVNGKYNEIYADKILIDNYGNICYCTPDQRNMYSLSYAYTHDGNTISIEPLLLAYRDNFNGNSSVQKEDKTKKLSQLKEAGFSVDDIIRLSKENLI